MSELQSAITSVAPRRGRRPAVLKDGTSVADARAAANAVIADARLGVREAKITLRDAVKKAKKAASLAKLAKNKLDKAKNQRFAEPSDKRDVLAAYKGASATAAVELKTANANEKTASAAFARAEKALVAARLAKTKLEEKYQASKLN